MKAACIIVPAILSLLLIREVEGREAPLMIDATPVADRWCDFPKQRMPLPKHRLNPMVNGLDKPNGDTA